MADKQQPKKRMGPWKWTLCVSLLVCCVDGSASNNQTAKPGDDVTLQCLGTRGAEIVWVHWTRHDLKEEEGYVFFFRNNRPYENYQYPSFRGRVKLINPEKDGDFSVILKNVRINDTGTYKCYVGMKNNTGSNNKPVHTISLTVTDSHPDQTAKCGDDVTLQCLGTRGAETLAVKWTRPDLKEEEGYVFYFKNNRLYEKYQHPSFRGRVKLRDPKLKDGDFSVILKNVRIDDTGTYECHVRMRNNPDMSVHNISLMVTDSHPGSTGGCTDRNLGLAVGLPVVAVVLGVVGFLIYKKKRGLIEQKSYQPAAQQADGSEIEQV